MLKQLSAKLCEKKQTPPKARVCVRRQSVVPGHVVRLRNPSRSSTQSSNGDYSAAKSSTAGLDLRSPVNHTHLHSLAPSLTSGADNFRKLVRLHRSERHTPPSIEPHFELQAADCGFHPLQLTASPTTTSVPTIYLAHPCLASNEAIFHEPVRCQPCHQPSSTAPDKPSSSSSHRKQQHFAIHWP